MQLLHDIPKEAMPVPERLLFGMHGLYTDLGLTDFIVSPGGRMWTKEYDTYARETRWTFLSDYRLEDEYNPYWSRLGRNRLAETKRVDPSLISVSDIDTSPFNIFFASPPLATVRYEDYPF